MKAPRTLQRALSTEQLHRRSVSRGPGNVIALMRSATSTSFSGIKREGSDSASLSATLKREDGAARQRPDLLPRNNSMANLEEVKATRRAQMEAELHDAISALRKPNREVVSKAMAEADERRVSASSSAKSKAQFIGSLYWLSSGTNTYP